MRFKYLLFLLTSWVSVYSQPLPRSLPESEGVSSEKIIQFLDAVANQTSHEFHSMMILRHGRVIAEGWWNPYRADLVHTMYSCSKSFTATAVGFAAAEKKLSLDDAVISFFPDKIPMEADPQLPNMTIRHLLTMTAGHRPDPTGLVITSPDWIRRFFELPIVDSPGSKFLYNSAATYMLSAIVQKVTGQKIIDYLKPRLFQPLGIDGIDWEVDPAGINTGGWGLRLKTEDMAKFAQLFLQNGKWKNKQLLSPEWVKAAGTAQIMQNPDARPGQKDSSDWLQGYGYQMWRSRHGYRGDGAFGQYMLILPEQDAVIAITSETPDMQGILNLVYQHLLPAFKAGKIKSNPTAARLLKSRLAALAIPPPAKTAQPGQELAVRSYAYAPVTTQKNLKNLTIKFENGIAQLTWITDSISHTIPFGFQSWVAGTTTRKGTYLVAPARSNREGLAPYKTIGAYTWLDDHRMEFTLKYIESPHTDRFIIKVSEDEIEIDEITLFNRTMPNRPKYRWVNQKNRQAPPRLIVRGDDMGFSHAANEALIKCYKEGIETSIEIIVPSPWYPEAIKMLQQNPAIDVGLHFAITAEWDGIKWRPLTAATSLRDENGYFFPMLFPNKNYPKNALQEQPYKLEEIEAELRAQITMARKHIPWLSHVSGHMGSTAFSPEVKAMVARVSKEMGIPMVDRDPINDHQIQYIGFDFRNKTTAQRIDGFIGMLDRLEDGKTYVFVEHPGLDTDELRAIHHIGYPDVAQGRQDVTTLFTSEKVKEAIARRGIQLVSYKEVLSGKKNE
jgi:CubicO group peptidase (beta-lactamase class C family)/predicted glycoside hydrolase/deacetylase ChbG (UPF0249 family)